MINVKTFTFNPFAENTYVLSDETKEAVIIDPGCYEPYEFEELVQYISDQGLIVKQLLNTHGHIDHILGNYSVKEHFKVDLSIYEGDLETMKAVSSYALNYGFQNYTECTPDIFLKEGDEVRFGNTLLEVIFVPGHAPGHIIFVNRDENLCIGGDALFMGSIGRTDLPGGDHDTLIASIQNKMFPLGDEMVVHCGHGPSTTIGHERMTNPFCAMPTA